MFFQPLIKIIEKICGPLSVNILFFTQKHCNCPVFSFDYKCDVVRKWPLPRVVMDKWDYSCRVFWSRCPLTESLRRLCLRGEGGRMSHYARQFYAIVLFGASITSNNNGKIQKKRERKKGHFWMLKCNY